MPIQVLSRVPKPKKKANGAHGAQPDAKRSRTGGHGGGKGVAPLSGGASSEVTTDQSNEIKQLILNEIKQVNKHS